MLLGEHKAGSLEPALVCSVYDISGFGIYTRSGSTTRKYTWGDVRVIFSFLSPHLHPHADKNEQKLKWKDISGMLFKSAGIRRRSPLKKLIIFDKAVVICQHLGNKDYSSVGVPCERLLLHSCWFAFFSPIACPSKRFAGPLRAVVSS